MYQDTPDDLVHDILAEVMWSGETFRISYISTYESLSKLNRNTIIDYLVTIITQAM